MVPIVKINDSMFGLTKQYFRKGKNGFTSATITGERRVGKTMYALQTVYQICRYEGLGKKESWKIALDSIIFTMKDLVNTLKSCTYENRRKFIIWDDAGVNASGLLYRYNMDNAAVLKALMDTVGTRVRLLMLTTPAFKGLMSFLRDYSDILINIEPYHMNFGYNGRLATIYSPYLAKNLVRHMAKAGRDEYNVKIRDDVYNKYVKIRDNFVNIITDELINYGENGREVIRENFGEDRALARQTGLQPDMVRTDTESEFSSD